MRVIIALFIILYLTSCNTTKEIDSELISYFWSFKDNKHNDTLVPYVDCYLYARISKNGNCKFIIYNKNSNNQFKSIDLDKNIISAFLLKVNKISNDTLLKNNCNYGLYDGPSIKIFAFNKEGKSIKLSFDDSNKSDLYFRKFYNYLDSMSLNSSFSCDFDTINLLEAQNRLVKYIKETDRRLLPLIIKDDVEDD